jgi:hypothetical protein
MKEETEEQTGAEMTKVKGKTGHVVHEASLEANTE